MYVKRNSEGLHNSGTKVKLKILIVLCGHNMEKQEMENGNGHGKRKRTWKMENLAHTQNVRDVLELHATWAAALRENSWI